MNRSEQPTCGKGLAENSVLPRNLGNVISTMAENLAVYMQALDLSDQNTKVEHDAYKNLVGQLRLAAAELMQVANEMTGYRDLPMGKHDQAAMRQPAVRSAFEQFLQRKQELLSLLQQTVDRDQQLLEMMRMHPL